MSATRLTPLAIVLFASVAGGAGAAEKPRVFVTEGHPLQITRRPGKDAAAPLEISAGSSRENVEVMKNFSVLCPDVVITSNREKATYVVRLDHEPINPLTPFVRGNKVAVFDRNDDLIYSGSMRLLAPAVKGACSAIAGAERHEK